MMGAHSIRGRATLFSLWRKARRENSAASRLLGSTSLRFALHGWQRGNRAVAGNVLPRNIFTFVISFLLWLLLTGSLKGEELMAGLLVSGVVTLLAAPRLALLDGVRWSFASFVSMLRYLGVFSLALLRANVDMARRVLSPSLPIRPAVVEVKTRLKSDLGRLLLANSITLTPGTLTIDIKGDHILVHWVDCAPGTDLDTATAEIVGQFESHLLEFLY